MKLKLILTLLILSALAYFYCSYSQTSKPLANAVKIDSIRVYKAKRVLQVLSGGKIVKSYSISLGGNPVGKKAVEGDKKTPEGLYYINDKNPHSGYYKNLGISYPNANDIKHAKAIGKPAGGQVKIHGMRNGWGFIGCLHLLRDWTNGCIALTNSEVVELYQNVTIGTPIVIYK